MGELILCNQMLAAFPFYIDQAAINVYSLEELSYYIEHNMYLLDAGFMNEELCSWVDRELGLAQTAEKLREIYQRGGGLAEFVTVLLRESGYCSPEQIRQITVNLTELEHKSEYECGKMRADRYAENRRYVNAIYEYRKLLDRKDGQDDELVGNVWHNLGNAYVGLFMFEEAISCFMNAYGYNLNPESLRECLYACRCARDNNRIQRIAAAKDISEEQLDEIMNDITGMSRMEEIRQFEEQLEEWMAAGKEQEILKIVDEWKDTYRKNCRI